MTKTVKSKFGKNYLPDKKLGTNTKKFYSIRCINIFFKVHNIFYTIPKKYENVNQKKYILPVKIFCWIHYLSGTASVVVFWWHHVQRANC